MNKYNLRSKKRPIKEVLSDSEYESDSSYNNSDVSEADEISEDLDESDEELNDSDEEEPKKPFKELSLKDLPEAVRQKLVDEMGKDSYKRLESMEDYITKYEPNMLKICELDIDTDDLLRLYRLILSYRDPDMPETDRISILLNFKEKYEYIKNTDYKNRINTTQGIQYFIKESNVSDNIKRILSSEYERVHLLDSDSSEKQSFYNWWFWVKQLPMHKKTIVHSLVLDSESYMNRVMGIMRENMYGLENVKMQVVSMIYQRYINPSLRTRAIGWIGPPGVGKTTMAYIVARCENRPLEKPNIGFTGSHGSEQIDGGTNMYVAGAPGQPVRALCSSGREDCCILLDEIDKIPDDSPIVQSILNLLDPDHNHAFIDRFISMFPVDFSKTCFMLTGNSPNLNRALVDRVEWIHIPEYTRGEREVIFEKFLFPKIQRELKASDIKFKDDALKCLFDSDNTSIRWLDKTVRRLCSEKILQRDYKDISNIFPKLKKWGDPTVICTSDIEYILGNDKEKSTAWKSMYL